MTDPTRVLLIDENNQERELTALVLRENVPQIDIVEAGTGLDYALGLAQPDVQVAIAAPSFSWGEGADVLSQVQRRHPKCTAMLLANDEFEPQDVGFECFRKSSIGLAELARAVRSRLPRHEQELISTPRPVAEVVIPDPYDHLWTELKNVQTLGQGLLEGDALGLETKQCVQQFLRGTERLDATIAYLFGDERVVEAERVPVKAADVVLSVMRLLQPQLQASAAKVMAGNLPVLLMDHNHLVRILHHLIDNAVKFRSAVPPRVTVRARKLGEEWQISVEDNGIGVDPICADTLFDMFSRSPKVSHLPGTGIGLAVCKRVAAVYDGRIWYRSNPTSGSTFFVSLRVREVEPDLVSLHVHCNGKSVGHIEVMSSADKNEITRAAIALPALNKAIGEQALMDVQLLENGILNIVF